MRTHQRNVQQRRREVALMYADRAPEEERRELVREAARPPDALPDRLLLRREQLAPVVRPLVRVAVQPEV